MIDSGETLGPGQPPAEDRASAAILTLIEDQLEEERTTKTSLETRAVSVVTTSGTLTTLLLGLAAVVTGRQSYELPIFARGLLVLAVLAFLTAVVLAIVAARPRAYHEVTVQSLRVIASPAHLGAAAGAAEPSIAAALIDIIDTARQRNGEKAARLTQAVMAEVVAAGLVALAVAVILLGPV